MRRLWKTFTLLIFLLILGGCFSFADAEAGYLDLGFTESDEIPAGYEDLFASIDEARILYEIHNFTKGTSTALVIEFHTKNDLNELRQSNEAFQVAIEDWDSTEIIQDTFVLIPIADSSSTEEWLIRIFLGTTTTTDSTN